MKILLDTHLYLWSLSEPERIAPDRVRELETPANTVYISSISIAEITIKASIGKLNLTFDPLEMIEKSGFEALDFGAKAAMLLGELPFHHRDSFDRMLIAQAMSENLFIMTDDSKFGSYSCRLI